MNINNFLSSAEKQLTDAGIQTARLDCLVLLSDMLSQDKAWLLAHPEAEINTDQQSILATQLEQRSKHIPLAYVRGKAEFYGRDFIVNEHVLVPRPESETMIELVKQHAPTQAVIADIGTGSGALAITAALEIPGVVVAAVDIDEACLGVAKRNAVIYTTPVQLFAGDLLEPFLQKSCNFKPTVLLANLPYVPQNYPINEAAGHEPALALFGGEDGLDLFRTLFKQAKQLEVEQIYTESLPEQHTELIKIATAHNYKLRTSDDFIQLFVLAP